MIFHLINSLWLVDVQPVPINCSWKAVIHLDQQQGKLESLDQQVTGI